MSHGFFATILYIPLYNLLVLLITIFPGHSAALAVILATILIRLVLFPLSKQAIKTQLLMKQIEGDMKTIRSTIKDKQEQAQATMKLYKEKGINPFASLLLIIIQIPILIELYSVFRSGLPNINTSILYSFIHAPGTVSMLLVGANLPQRIILALLAVVTQFIQVNLSLPKTKRDKSKERNFQEDLAHSMNLQMRFILPIIMFPVAYISAVVGLYLIATNVFTIFQELFVRRRMMKQYAVSSQVSTQ